MNLPQLSVKRPTLVSMFFLGIVLVGVVSFGLLPVEMMPNMSFGDITIIIDVRGGIPPSEIEKRVCKPIEEAVGTVTHLKNILSISKEGNATIILEFEPGTDMDFAALEVREKFARIRNKLPPEIEKPIIAKYEYMDVPIMILAVTSDQRIPEEIRKLVDEKIKERIERIEGVARVEVSGGREGKILIEVDQHKLQAYSLPITRVVDIINLNNFNLLAGEIERVRDKYLVRAMGEFRSLKELEEMGIATTRQGSIIRLKDIAEVKDSYLEPTGFARVNIQPVVSLYVQKESTANTIRVAGGINEELRDLEQILDKDIKITSTFNQADFIKRAVDAVKLSLVWGAILATLILFAFLRDWRTTLIIGVSIPICVITTFSLMYFQKITLNVMTLSGLALGVGMLVDNSIVVLENIFKKRKELVNTFPEAGTSPAATSGTVAAPLVGASNSKTEKDIAIQGAEEMLLAIVASTITTVVVFLPLVFVNPEIKMLYSGLALTIVFSLLASLLVSLTLVPMLAARLKIEKKRKNFVNTNSHELPACQTQWSNRAGRHTNLHKLFIALKKFVLICVQFVSIRAPKKDLFKPSYFSRLKDFYHNSISSVIQFRYLVALFAFVAFAQTLYISTKLEKEFIGIAEQNRFTIFIEMPTGTRLEVSDRIVTQVEQLVSKLTEVKTATAKVEPWSSKVYVELLPLNQREKSTGEIIEELRPETQKIQPAFIYFEEPEEVGTKEILLEIYGYDYETLKMLAIEVARRLQSIPKLTDVKIRMREGRPEMRLAIDKKRAAMFGLSVEEISLNIHTQMRGLVATRYRGGEPLIRLKEETSLAAGPRIPSKEEEEVLRKKTEELSRGKDLFYPISPEAKEVETIVRLEEKFRRTFADLHRLSLVTPQGEQVYLEQISEFKYDLGPSEVWRKNKSRMVQVSANTGGMALGTVAGKVKETLSDLKFPKDYFWQFGGNYDKMIRNQKELTFAFWLTLILVFMVLASLFESILQPFIIMVSVPLATIGVVAALKLTNKPIGIGVLIGAIMLAGIVVNNAIILIDHINFLRRKSGAPYGHRGLILKSVITACEDRLRPILMTTLTTILGLLPMALDRSESANLWSPLAITVIGGLTTSTILTLFVVPSVYVIFEDFKLGKR